jgi:acetolactate synthase regulatory subunit
MRIIVGGHFWIELLRQAIYQVCDCATVSVTHHGYVLADLQSWRNSLS